MKICFTSLVSLFRGCFPNTLNPMKRESSSGISLQLTKDWETKDIAQYIYSLRVYSRTSLCQRLVLLRSGTKNTHRPLRRLIFRTMRHRGMKLCSSIYLFSILFSKTSITFTRSMKLKLWTQRPICKDSAPCSNNLFSKNRKSVLSSL